MVDATGSGNTVICIAAAELTHVGSTQVATFRCKSERRNVIGAQIRGRVPTVIDVFLLETSLEEPGVTGAWDRGIATAACMWPGPEVPGGRRAGELSAVRLKGEIE